MNYIIFKIFKERVRLLETICSIALQQIVTKYEVLLIKHFRHRRLSTIMKI